MRLRQLQLRGGAFFTHLSLALLCWLTRPPQAYLRLANVPFVSEPCATPDASPTGAPRHRAPRQPRSPFAPPNPRTTGSRASARAHSPPGALPALLFDGDAAPPAELASDGDEAQAATAAAAYAAAQGFDLDVQLTPPQRADAAAFRALIQERVAPALVSRPACGAAGARRRCDRGSSSLMLWRLL